MFTRKISRDLHYLIYDEYPEESPEDYKLECEFEACLMKDMPPDTRENYKKNFWKWGTWGNTESWGKWTADTITYPVTFFQPSRSIPTKNEKLHSEMKGIVLDIVKKLPIK